MYGQNIPKEQEGTGEETYHNKGITTHLLITIEKNKERNGKEGEVRGRMKTSKDQETEREKR